MGKFMCKFGYSGIGMLGICNVLFVNVGWLVLMVFWCGCMIIMLCLCVCKNVMVCVVVSDMLLSFGG